MKLSAIFQTCKASLKALPSNELYQSILFSFSLMAILAIAIWFYGPHLYYNQHAPFATVAMRLYAITAAFSLWLLKILLIDFNVRTIRPKDPEIRHHLQALTNRFRGAIEFMKKTSITHAGKPVSLQQLPWFVLLGGPNAGKTAMLAHSKIPFILQKQFGASIPEHFEPSENCDWWLTREGGMIDVPSKYLFTKPNSKKNLAPALWGCFLQLLKQHSGKKYISGIAVAVPFAELTEQNDPEATDRLINTLGKHIRSIEGSLQKKLPIYLIVTKSDLLPGFGEFFSESAEDETSQAWGITIPACNDVDDTAQQFMKRFNAIIKKLNEQLLWRMHHERNPMARPLIKDFPLQMEKLKGSIQSFITKLGHARIQGVFLTSAMQVKPEPETIVIDNDINHDSRSLQIFQDPAAKSRSFFIRQLITDSLFPKQQVIIPVQQPKHWGHYTTYAACAAAVVAACIVFGRDFNEGFRKTQQIENNIVTYRNTLRQFQNPNESLIKTLSFLDTLQQSSQEEENQTIFSRVINYYSNKSQRNAVQIYQHSLQTFLMPEIRNYFANYLDNPINQDAENIYRVLKAYLMLGDTEQFNASYVRDTLFGILPNKFTATAELQHHFDLAAEQFNALPLNDKLIINTRKYLLSLRGSQLGFIILKNISNNAQNSDVLLSRNADENLLFNNNRQDPIAVMFTGRNFTNVYDHEIQVAAFEAANGNWVLGTGIHVSANPTYAAELGEALRADYVKNYVAIWENAVDNIRLQQPHDLQQADAMITALTSYDSPLIKLLNTIHENTYFTPVSSASPKLTAIGQLVDKSNASKAELYGLLTNLQALHDYLQPVLSAENPRKAAFELISDRMKHQGEPDPITKLRLSADQSPLPIKTWINQLSNDTWHYLLKNAMRYMDTSWSEQVATPYRELANRYPFAKNATDEVPLKNFIQFFGKPGSIVSYYNNYLQPFIDTTKTEWSWKQLDGETLPFSPAVLHQVQQAMTIHHAFFPNDDNNLYVPFALQQEKVAANVNKVTLNINNKVIVDKRGAVNNPHVLAWPHDLTGNMTTVEVATVNGKPLLESFPGSWGWFKLINQAYVGTKFKKDILLNFARNSATAEYVLSPQDKTNPFTALNLSQFTLDNQLTTIVS